MHVADIIISTLIVGLLVIAVRVTRSGKKDCSSCGKSGCHSCEGVSNLYERYKKDHSSS